MKVSNDLSLINIISTNNTNKVKNVLSQLSSGKKALTAGPANVGISSRTSAEISGSTMAIKNLDKSISAVDAADSLLAQTDSNVTRMKELAVKYNSGTLSDADKINTEVEFKALQRDVSRMASKYTETAQSNSLYLTSIPSATESDLASVSDDAAIGTINQYTYDDNNKVTASTHTDVSWKDITTMSISDSEVIGKLDAAADFTAKATTNNAVTQKTLESRKSALIKQESNLMDEEAALLDIDMASGSTELTSSLINNSASTAISAQALNLNSFTTLSVEREKVLTSFCKWF
jgi:flagellin